MAVSGKTSTLEIPYFLGTDKPPDMAAVTKAMAEKMEAILTAPTARVRREAKQSIANETFVAIEFTGTEYWDTASIHNPASNPSRLVAPVAGLYRVQGFLTFEGSETGLRNVVIGRGALPGALGVGSAFAEHSEKGCAKVGEGAGGNAINISADIPLKAAEYVQLLVWQNSGGALNVMGGDGIHTAEFGMTWTRPSPV